MSILCTGSADHKGGGVAELKPYKVGHKNLLYSHNCFRFPSFQLFGGMGPRTSRVKAQRCPGHCIADDEQNGNYGEDTFSPGLQSRQNQLKTHRMEGEAKYEHKSWIQFVSDILQNQQYSPAQKDKLDQWPISHALSGEAWHNSALLRTFYQSYVECSAALTLLRASMLSASAPELWMDIGHDLSHWPVSRAVTWEQLGMIGTRPQHLLQHCNLTCSRATVRCCVTLWPRQGHPSSF